MAKFVCDNCKTEVGLFDAAKMKVRGDSVPVAMGKFKKNFEESMYLRGVLKDVNARKSEKGMADNIKSIKSQIKDADMLTNMWIDAFKKALKG